MCAVGGGSLFFLTVWGKAMGKLVLLKPRDQLLRDSLVILVRSHLERYGDAEPIRNEVGNALAEIAAMVIAASTNPNKRSELINQIDQELERQRL
jgi:hypothetical protein